MQQSFIDSELSVESLTKKYSSSVFLYRISVCSCVSKLYSQHKDGRACEVKQYLVPHNNK